MGKQNQTTQCEGKDLFKTVMASFIKRNNGFYYVVTSDRGRRIWRSLETRVESEARATYEGIERSDASRKKMLLSWFSEEFFQKAAVNLAKTTVRLHRSAFGHLIRLCGDISIRRISPVDVEAFKSHRGAEVSPVTLNIDLRLLRAAFNEAKRLKYISENPFAGVKLARVPMRRAAYIPEDQFAPFLSLIGDPQFRDLVVFATFTMMRRGEVLNLEWLDIDLTRRLIYIRNKANFTVKTGRERTVMMSGWVYQFLLTKARNSRYVFSGTRGQRLVGSTTSHQFKKFVRRAKLDDHIHFHSLRHTGISWLANNGTPLSFVQQLAGHSSLRTTQIYTHLEDKNLRAAIDSFPLLDRI